MPRPLYPYYERELAFLRQSARDFARQYPATAGRLLLEPGRSADPHVERLLEGVALLAGRVRHKLDDEFPELTTGLLGVLYPHFLAPVPSCAVVQFDPDPARVNVAGGHTLAAGTRLHTQAVNGLRCRYRTTSPVTLWPVALTQTEWLPPPFPRGVRPPARTAAVLRIRLEAQAGARLAGLGMDRLRLFLSADPQLVPPLYEALLNDVLAVTVRDPDAGDDPGVTRPAADALAPGGFDPADGFLPYPPHALPGYRLLTEYFAFPQKFWFVDLIGLGAARAALGGRRADVLVYLRKTAPSLEQGVDATTFRPGCAPAVNLFEQTAEPVPVTHTKAEYPVVPSVAFPYGMEVYSVTDVSVTSPSAGGPVAYRPFYAVRYRDPAARRFWAATRRASVSADDRGTDLVLTLVDADFRPDEPADGVLVARTLCTNRDLPDRLRQSGVTPRFDPEMAVPVTRVRCLVGPTAPLRPFGRRGFWPLISHLNLGHLGLNEDAEATAALKGLLGLYDLTDGDAGDPRSAAARQAVDGITQVYSRPVTRRVGKLTAAGFVRGLEVDLQLDEEKFTGVGAFLFAAVLERFFALHATANSFTQLVLRTRAGGDPVKTWPPRAGGQPLL